jgi:hypothetical protein
LNELLDLDACPVDKPDSPEYAALVTRCQLELNSSGMFNLVGLLRQSSCERAVREISPIMNESSFEHRRMHNIYFLKEIPGLEAGHPALNKIETINHTVCADQIPGSVVMKVYEYQPLLRFIAEVMSKPCLYLMDDPLARANVMAYRKDEALNWHFDRSEFTTTLLLQSPSAGGVFEYRTGLRSDEDPNYEGVARLLSGKDREKCSMQQTPGTLNVFRGKNTAHRVTPIEGDRERMIAVFSYYEHRGKVFSKEERLGFYGRAQ